MSLVLIVNVIVKVSFPILLDQSLVVVVVFVYYHLRLRLRLQMLVLPHVGYQQLVHYLLLDREEEVVVEGVVGMVWLLHSLSSLVLVLFADDIVAVDGPIYKLAC